MSDAFRAAKLARKRRVKWWRGHIALAYATVFGFFAGAFALAAFVDRRLPLWLASFGFGPSAVNLLLGTIWCGVGVWGLGAGSRYGAGWVVLYSLCLLSGVLALARAFNLV